MAPPAAKNVGKAIFQLGAADLSKAKDMGLLRDDVSVQQSDPDLENFGVAYHRRDNIGTDLHGSQKAIQAHCKSFTQSCGFQLKVAGFSSKGKSGGNAKYMCKKLNGQQFFDKESPQDEQYCPFFINTSGVEGSWKLTHANFCHNHLNHVGFLGRPVAEGTIPRPAKDKRNTTQSVEDMTRLVHMEMLPQYEGRTERMTGAAISEFFLGKGLKIGRSAISRIKRSIEESNHEDRLTSYTSSRDTSV